MVETKYRCRFCGRELDWVIGKTHEIICEIETGGKRFIPANLDSIMGRNRYKFRNMEIETDDAWKSYDSTSEVGFSE